MNVARARTPASSAAAAAVEEEERIHSEHLSAYNIARALS